MFSSQRVETDILVLEFCEITSLNIWKWQNYYWQDIKISFEKSDKIPKWVLFSCTRKQTLVFSENEKVWMISAKVSGENEHNFCIFAKTEKTILVYPQVSVNVCSSEKKPRTIFSVLCTKNYSHRISFILDRVMESLCKMCKRRIYIGV